MKKIDILFKSITLLYRESLLGDVTSDSSKELVRTIISQLKKTSKPLMGENTMLDDLMDLCIDMVNNSEAFTKENR